MREPLPPLVPGWQALREQGSWVPVREQGWQAWRAQVPVWRWLALPERASLPRVWQEWERG